MIDDCSTDRTVDAVEAYGRVHSNLTLLVQPQNHRQGAARNRGLEIAHGEFIVFLDSDDEIAPGVLSAWNLSKKYDLDMAVMHCVKLSFDGTLDREFVLPYASDMVITGVSLQTEHPFWFTGPCAYLFSASFLKNVNYPFAEDVLFEDTDFVNVHLLYAARIVYCDETGLIVWSNPLSTTHTFSYKHVCDYALLGTRMLSLYSEIVDKSSIYAHSILEGGSYNVMRSCKNLFKLNSFSDVRAFYNRFDLLADRLALLSYSEPAYYWTHWTRFCMKYKRGAILIVGLVLAFKHFPLLKRKDR